VIWASKTVAALVITLTAWAAFVLPLYALSWRRIAKFAFLDPVWLPLWGAGLLSLILLVQAVAGAYRARDGLFAVDLAILAALTAVATAVGWQLSQAGAGAAVRWMVRPGVATIVVAAAVAAALQVVVGRTDPRRGHLALSGCLWGTTTAALLMAVAFSSWVLSVGPNDLGVGPWGAQSTASGSHVAFVGRVSRFGYLPFFVLNTETGTFDRIPLARLLGFTFSADGRRAAWVEAGEEPKLALRRLDEPKASVIRSPLRGFRVAPRLARLSPDGREAVVATAERIAVVDTDSGREAASARLEQLGVDARSSVLHSRCAFVGDTVVGFFVPPPSTDQPLVISTFDFRTGLVRHGPTVPGVEWVRAIRNGRALVSGRNGPLTLVDGAGILRLLEPEPGLVLSSATLLDGGEIVALFRKGANGHFAKWDPEGKLLLDVPFPPQGTRGPAYGPPVFFGAEPQPGWIAVGLDDGRPSRTLFVSTATGAILREEPGLLPAAARHMDQELPPGSPGARLFIGDRGELVRLDPQTGRREAVIVPPHPRRTD